jgi:ECF sigma factor
LRANRVILTYTYVRLTIQSGGSAGRAVTGDVTALLIQWSDGDALLLERIFPLVYDELRRIAARHMRRESPNHLLQATALVNEAYLKLVDQEQTNWKDRVHFFAIAAKVMRHGSSLDLTCAERPNMSRRDVRHRITAGVPTAPEPPRSCRSIRLRPRARSCCWISRGRCEGDRLTRSSDKGFDRDGEYFGGVEMTNLETAGGTVGCNQFMFRKKAS